MNKTTSSFILMASMVIAVGCTSPESHYESNTGNIELAVPTMLASTRAVNQNNLRAEIRVGEQVLPIVRNGDIWQGSINLEEGNYPLTVNWFESTRDFEQNGTEIQLATLSKDIEMGSTNTTVALSFEEYLTDFDQDGDGIENLSERRDGSNPFDAQSPRTDGVDVSIPFISPSDAPVVDGLFDSIWNEARFSNVNGETLAISNLVSGSDPIRTDGNTEFRWAAMHDESNLYILVLYENVDGSALFGDSTNPLDDDNLRLYWDGNNSGKIEGSVYDQFDDYAIRIPIKNTQTAAANSSASAGRISIGSESVALPTNFVFATCGCIAGQHVWEIKIPFASSGIASRQPLGFELQIDDDQDGGPSDASWAWNVAAGSTVSAEESPMVFGTILLE